MRTAFSILLLTGGKTSPGKLLSKKLRPGAHLFCQTPTVLNKPSLANSNCRGSWRLGLTAFSRRCSGSTKEGEHSRPFLRCTLTSSLCLRCASLPAPAFRASNALQKQAFLGGPFAFSPKTPRGNSPSRRRGSPHYSVEPCMTSLPKFFPRSHIESLELLSSKPCANQSTTTGRSRPYPDRPLRDQAFQCRRTWTSPFTRSRQPCRPYAVVPRTAPSTALLILGQRRVFSAKPTTPKSFGPVNPTEPASNAQRTEGTVHCGMGPCPQIMQDLALAKKRPCSPNCFSKHPLIHFRKVHVCNKILRLTALVSTLLVKTFACSLLFCHRTSNRGLVAQSELAKAVQGWRPTRPTASALLIEPAF